MATILSHELCAQSEQRKLENFRSLLVSLTTLNYDVLGIVFEFMYGNGMTRIKKNKFFRQIAKLCYLRTKMPELQVSVTLLSYTLLKHKKVRYNLVFTLRKLHVLTTCAQVEVNNVESSQSVDVKKPEAHYVLPTKSEHDKFLYRKRKEEKVPKHLRKV